jgi:hypothetical protein
MGESAVRLLREAQTVLAAALERKEVPVLERARWHRLLGEIHMQLGEMRPARDHFERTLSRLGSPLPGSTPGLLDVLASQALQRRLRRLRPGGPVERREDRRIAAEERAAACWRLAEADWQLEEWSPLLPIALRNGRRCCRSRCGGSTKPSAPGGATLPL